MKSNYSKDVILLCPICGGDYFQYDETDNESPVTCNNCKQSYTRLELQEMNQNNINQTVQDLTDEVVDDIAKHLNRKLKKLGG